MPSPPASNSPTNEEINFYYSHMSFYFLNFLKANDKLIYLKGRNLFERVKFVFGEYKQIELQIDNQSLPFEFFDLDIPGSMTHDLKFTVILLIGFVLIIIAYKYNLIE